MRTSSSLGIYFERDRIDLICVRRSFQGITVKDYISLPLPQNGEGEDLYKKLRDFIKETQCEESEVYVGLPRKDTILLHLELPSPTEENLRDVLGYELDRHTPYSKEEAYFDFQIIGRDKEKRNIRVLLFVVPKKRLNNCLEILKKVNLSPKSVEISSTALIKSFSCHRDVVEKGKYAFLHIGKEADELIMVDNGSFCYSRTFSARPHEEVDCLSAELERALMSKGWNQEEVKEIVLGGEVGGDRGELLQGLEERVQCKIAILEGLPKGLKGEALPSHFLVPYGLSLRGIGKGLSPINLLPSVQKLRKERKWYWTALPLILMLLLGGGVIVTPLIQGKKVLDNITEEINRLEPESRDLQGLEKEVQELEKKLDQLTSIRSEGIHVLQLLKELTDVIPANTWFTDLRYKENKVEIAGYSSSASSLIPILESSPLFAKVEFSAPVTTTEGQDRFITGRGVRRAETESKPVKTTGMEQFKIKAVLEGGP